MQFELFDRNADFAVREGNLPHWYQPGVTYFVTFRTDDSVPVEVAKAWHYRRQEWLRRHGVNPAASDWKSHFYDLPASVQLEFDRTFTAEFMKYLDRGHGACVLRHPDIAKVVADSLKHFDGQRYYLGDFVVMPNHVHVLCCLLGATEIENQCYSWKKYTAHKINIALGNTGRFWQEESFDHLVRSPEQFEYFRRYIEWNSDAARLRSGEYLHYRAPK